MFLVLTVLLVVSGLAGCAEVVKVAFERQVPPEMDLKRDQKIESIAVLNFDGPADSGLILADLFAAKLVQGQYYTVVEREKLNKILNEQKLGMTGMIDEKAAAMVGKLAGIQAIVMGRVASYSFTDEPYTKTVMTDRKTMSLKPVCNDKGKCTQEQIVEQVPMTETYHRRNTTVSATQKVVHVESGQVIWSKIATEQLKYDTGKPSKEEGLVNMLNKFSDSIFVGLLNNSGNSNSELGQSESLAVTADKVSDVLAGSIQPHKIKEEGEFELGGWAKFLGEMGADKEIKHGIEMIKSGRVDDAIHKYESVASRDPKNCSAAYNVGIIHMQSDDFQKADTAFRVAENCNLNNARYSAAVGENKKRWDKAKEDQRKNSTNSASK
ncbi:MAG: CsgG/HfaB family protein [Nitrospirota bacterium]